MSEKRAWAQQLCDLAHHLGRMGWLPATSGNLSVRVSKDPDVIAITRSGVDKQHLTVDDIIYVDSQMQLVEPTPYKPSAETIVHTLLYQQVDCGCVLHVHTLYNNLCSQICWPMGKVHLAHHELLKALGHWEEGAAIDVPIVENFADLQRLGEAVRGAAAPGVPGVLVRNHGIYAWGGTLADAKRHLEAFEFLFQYTLLLRQHMAYDRTYLENLSASAQ